MSAVLVINWEEKTTHTHNANEEQHIVKLRKALAHRPFGHPTHALALNNLAQALETRFKQSKERGDLNEAIMLYREVLFLHPSRHPTRALSLNNLAIALETRYEQFGENEDLDVAITFYHEALALHPSGHSSRAPSLNNLTIALRSRFKKSGRKEDADAMITLYHEALALCPSGHPTRAPSINNLAEALRIRCEHFGGNKDLDAAITLYNDALALRPSGHPARASSLNNLAIALKTRFNQFGEKEDLDAVITLYREALALRPSEHPNHAPSLNNLAEALRIRFEHFGGSEDLDTAIKVYGKALILHPSGDSTRVPSLAGLAKVLETCFVDSSQKKDLDTAIMLFREACTLCPSGHPARAQSLNNLAEVRRTRFKQFREKEDLDATITLYNDTLALHPFRHPARALSLNNLAKALRARFKQAGREEDLHKAVTLHLESLELRPSGHPVHVPSLNNLTKTYRTRFKHSGVKNDLDAMIALLHESIALLPPGHPARTHSLKRLASALEVRFEKSGGNETFAETFDLFERATMERTSPSIARFRAAREWADVAGRHQHSSTLRAYSMALTILQRCLIVTPAAALQKQLLVSHPGSFASDAAFHAIQAGQLETAVEFLEQGRSITWTRMGRYRLPLLKLRQASPELAGRFESISTQLEHLTISSDFESMATSLAGLRRSSVDRDAKITLINTLALQFDEVLGEIRATPHFENFLQAAPFATLSTAAKEGPVVVFNINRHSSHAIILHLSRPFLVTLSEATPQTIGKLASDLDAVLSRPNIHPSEVIPILRSLWHCIVCPVTDMLRGLGVAEKTRIWWCPTSILCTLPIHAAGSYLLKEKNTPDMYISSYTPTLFALIEARAAYAPRPAVPRLLAVGQMYQGQSGDALQRVREELDCIEQLDISAKLLVDEGASLTTVFSELKIHSWVHFACHGRLNADEPLHSSLELHDKQHLTLFFLIQNRLPRAELAFLSACHSAAGGNRMPDESIHLAAALLFCGFRSTVGTLWAMADTDGPLIVEEFYKSMFRQGNEAHFLNSAKALNEATKEMRRRKVPIERWICFVHIGA